MKSPPKRCFHHLRRLTLNYFLENNSEMHLIQHLRTFV